VRSRRGAQPTEFGAVVLERARRINRELEAMHDDLSMLRGLESGHAGLGVVGTASRWLVPDLVADLQRRAPGVRLRVTEGASERLFAEVVGGQLGQAVVTEPVTDRRLEVEHLLDEALVAVVGGEAELPPEPVPLRAVAAYPLVLPPESNPLRIELETMAEAQGVTLRVPVEVEGIRLIGDLVAAGTYASILPETAIAQTADGVRTLTIDRMPPRRLAIVRGRDVQLSLADQAVREAIDRIIATRFDGRAIGDGSMAAVGRDGG
jgi:DNA-binding transcriptional LysR family regulator